MVHRLPTREQYLEYYKIIYLENNLDLFKKTYEYIENNDNNKILDFKYKYFTKIGGSTQKYRYHEFFHYVKVLYKIYSLVKYSKNFEDLIKKIYALKFSDINKNIYMPLDRLYFEPNQLKENEDSLLMFFLISKWMGLKPNNEYKNYFKKIEKLLKETKFTGQFN
jgi:hypothetical protein